ncbi:MAG: hypothetical protein HW412_2513, partial [Bacteroidetes bacterium]|nr:hypothetical protein [Bacteroidota bacterium]
SGYLFVATSGHGIYRSVQPTTSIRGRDGELPAGFSLSQNYPNPFNPSTTIQFSLPRSDHVSLKVFNVLGEEIAVLVDEEQVAGNHSVNWDARLPGGQASSLASGVYFYRLTVSDLVETKKLMLLK